MSEDEVLRFYRAASDIRKRLHLKAAQSNLKTIKYNQSCGSERKNLKKKKSQWLQPVKTAPTTCGRNTTTATDTFICRAARRDLNSGRNQINA